MRIRFNGIEMDFRGETVADLLNEFRLEGDDLAVERNLKLLHPGEYGTARIEEGDEVGVVRFVGGG